VLDAADRIRRELSTAGVRVHLDARDGMKPGAKYYEWEGRGVPLRLEVGPRDVAAGAVVLARRTGGKKETLEPEGGQEYAGETIACNMTRYNRHVDESVQNAGARQGTFWYAALLPGGDILVPVRMRLRTQIGSVDVYLAEAQGRGVDIQLMK